MMRIMYTIPIPQMVVVVREAPDAQDRFRQVCRGVDETPYTVSSPNGVDTGHR